MRSTSAFQLPLGLALGLAVALPAINQIAVNSSQNFANAVNAFAGPDSPVLLLAISAITPIFAGLTNFGDTSPGRARLGQGR